MGDRSTIEWTSATWNPIRGCSRVSEGCRNCYAERTAVRMIHAQWTGQPDARTKVPGPYHGLVKSTPSGPRWTGAVRFVPEVLGLPLSWKAPRRIFVNSMSDLFHEKVASEWVDCIFGVVAYTPQHTYQILTKRAETMLSYCGAMAAIGPKARARRVVESMYRGHPAERMVTVSLTDEHVGDFPWPLPNVWLGVSVEDQATADERIPLLLQTPAALRWVSYEPALGPVDFHQRRSGQIQSTACPTCNGSASVPVAGGGTACPTCFSSPEGQGGFAPLDWIVVGGESGPGARPFDLAWARQTIAQCRAASVPCFVKQLGARPKIAAAGTGPDTLREQLLIDGEWPEGTRFGNPIGDPAFNGLVPILRDRKGGDPAEWPSDLRVREYPS